MIEEVTAYKLKCDSCNNKYYSGFDGELFQEPEDAESEALNDGWTQDDQGIEWYCDKCSLNESISQLKAKYND